MRLRLCGLSECARSHRREEDLARGTTTEQGKLRRGASARSRAFGTSRTLISRSFHRQSWGGQVSLSRIVSVKSPHLIFGCICFNWSISAEEGSWVSCAERFRVGCYSDSPAALCCCSRSSLPRSCALGPEAWSRQDFDAIRARIRLGFRMTLRH